MPVNTDNAVYNVLGQMLDELYQPPRNNPNRVINRVLHVGAVQDSETFSLSDSVEFDPEDSRYAYWLNMYNWGVDPSAEATPRRLLDSLELVGSVEFTLEDLGELLVGMNPQTGTLSDTIEKRPGSDWSHVFEGSRTGDGFTILRFRSDEMSVHDTPTRDISRSDYIVFSDEGEVGDPDGKAPISALFALLQPSDFPTADYDPNYAQEFTAAELVIGDASWTEIQRVMITPASTLSAMKIEATVTGRSYGNTATEGFGIRIKRDGVVIHTEERVADPGTSPNYLFQYGTMFVEVPGVTTEVVYSVEAYGWNARDTVRNRNLIVHELR